IGFGAGRPPPPPGARPRALEGGPRAVSDSSGYHIARLLPADAIGTDLLVRIAADDGSEQVVRYHWGGDRMTVVNDERRFRKSGAGCDPDETPAPDCATTDGRRAR
ncbi:hypothetical protein ACFV0A_26950, partial [Streptomyces sp. NPDC059552]